MNDRSQFDLTSFLQTVRRRRWLIAAIALASALLAFGISTVQADRFEASADLLFSAPEPTPSVDPNEPLPDTNNAPERLAATNLALSSLESVTARVRDALNSPLTLDELRDRVKLEPKGQADIVMITATGGSRQEAVRIANTFADQVVALRRERAQAKIQNVIDAIDARIPAITDEETAQAYRQRADQLRVEKELEDGDVEIAQEAVPPRERSSPKPLRNTVVGGLLGLILGTLVAMLLTRFDRRLESEDEVVEIVGAPIIARVPEETGPAWQRQLFMESFQFLRSNLQLRGPDARERVIAVTSGMPGTGKTTVTARLAEALALGGARVIAVDFDLRRPALHKHFGVDGVEGVTTAILGGRQVRDLLQDTAVAGVRVLGAGPVIPIPASIMARPERLNPLISQLRAEADYVIIDTSPVTIGADASAVTAVAEGTIMVVDMETIRRDVLQAATEQLRNARARTIGVVLNRAGVLLHDQAYQGYYAPGPVAGMPAPANGHGEPKRTAQNGSPAGEARASERGGWRRKR